MGRFQQKGSHERENPKSVPDQRSATNLVLARRTLEEGNMQVRKRVDASKLVSDYNSCSRGSTGEDSFMCDLRRDYSKQTNGTPTKKVVVEESVKQMESRRRPPNVIARLMGLDALPSQQPIHKQKKKFSENYLQRTTSISSVGKSSSYEGRSFSMSNKEQQEFKDVFEVLDTEKAEKYSNLSVQKETANSKLSESKMDIVRQKFMDVKRLSTNEKLQQSKEFHDALEVLDSNKDLLVKFLQEQDSLFTKHPHDLQGVPPSHQSGHVTVLKSSNAHNFENRDKCCKLERKKECKDLSYSLQKHVHDGVSHSYNKNGAHISSKVSKKSQLDEKDESCLLPTRIVVLKPNLRMVQNTDIPVSSPNSSGGLQSSYKKHKEYRSSENLEIFAEVRDRRNPFIEMELMKHRDPYAQGSREIAKEITRKMRHNISNGSIKVSRSTLRGYAADESSYTTSGNDSANEFDGMTPTSRHFYDQKSRHSPSSSYSTESSVLREAKKRLSERWKITHRFQEVGMVSGRSTLGEMLSMPDRETRPTVSDSTVGQGGFSDRLARNNGIARWGSPLGISSRDGWKDECARSLPRSRSLPASSTTSISHIALGSDRISMMKDNVNWGSNRSENGDSDQRAGFSSKSNKIHRTKKSQSFHFVGGEKNCTVKETLLKPDKLRMSEEKGSSEQKPMTIELQVYDHEESIQIITDAVAKPWGAETSFETHEEQLPSVKACITSVKDINGSAYEPDDSIAEITSIGPPEETSLASHCTEADSPSISKEAEQPSPVSVLEHPFEDVSSGSNSFERVSADLHELRMQLQLLKLEPPDAYLEGSEMIVSSDEDTREGSFGLLKESREVGILRDEENRDFSYLVDTLVDSGFHDADQDMLLAMSYSPECPVGPHVFEMLEKKYGEQAMWPKSERRLLFDWINLGLMEILQLNMDPHPWVKPVRRVGLGRSEEEPLTEELWRLLVSECKVGSMDSLEKVLGKETGWLDLGDDTDVVGREIERLLIDELVTEVVST